MKLNVLSPWIIASSIFIFTSHQAYAKKSYGMAGCGLGSIVMGGDGGQVSAATTNGTSSSQSWGIVSGTSNCKTTKEMAVLYKQHEFLTANLATLQKELAQGKGATISAFVEVLGCSQDVQDEASSQLIKNYNSIFSRPGIGEILDGAKETIGQDNRVAARCLNLG